MAQIKIYGIGETLQPIKRQLSDVIHSCVVEALKIPVDKRFHRFIPLEKDDFYYPPDRSKSYIIIEVSIFEGRSIDTKRLLIRLLIDRIDGELKIAKHDIEITIYETPRSNWGIRGRCGDELELSYKVET
jgi:phenylpyruvate tautomerase PptA (4-oxalocrotonate tautomerase family)